MKLFVCGDVMLGRGIDQILPHPSDPQLYEPAVASAIEYVELAERAHGPLPRTAPGDYVWGDALTRLRDERPHVRIINLETSITTSDRAEQKGINYRMHPANVSVLTAADIDCCVLANNHVMDWGVDGLLETLDVLHNSRIHTAGSGRTLAEAQAPAIIDLGSEGRVLVFGAGSSDSGVPGAWAAGESKPGVFLLDDYSNDEIERFTAVVRRTKRDRDVAIASIHWGGNWGYEIPHAHRRFAHALIDRAGIDLVHGHSSHHPKAFEFYHGKPILYGCGDFLNDYEGISGYEEFRADLVGMYFASIDPRSERAATLDVIPLQIHRFQLREPSAVDAAWFQQTLDRASRRLVAQ